MMWKRRDMGFVNSKLKPDEIREYVCGWPREGEVISPGGCTIDRDNDIRLMQYANGAYTGEPCDDYQFVFDYKGKISCVNLKRTLRGNDVHWYLLAKWSSDHRDYSNENDVMNKLREAVRAFAYCGFINMKMKHNPNEDAIVYIEF